MTANTTLNTAIEPYPYPDMLPDPNIEPDMQEHRHVSIIYPMLWAFFIGRADVLVSGKEYLCFTTRSSQSTWLVPDCIVAFGVDLAAIEARNGYVIGEVGKPPDFVLEIASRRTGERDYTVKRDGYAGYGVCEYWRFDATGGQYHDRPLAGDLVNGRYEPFTMVTKPDGMIWGHSPALGLDLCWENGHLRFYDPVTHRYLPDMVEALDERDVERAGRISAEIERDTERSERILADARASESEAEVRMLRERLRQYQSE